MKEHGGVLHCDQVSENGRCQTEPKVGLYKTSAGELHGGRWAEAEAHCS